MGVLTPIVFLISEKLIKQQLKKCPTTTIDYKYKCNGPTYSILKTSYIVVRRFLFRLRRLI